MGLFQSWSSYKSRNSRKNLQRTHGNTKAACRLEESFIRSR